MTDLTTFIENKRQNRLSAYKSEPADIREHAGIEETVLAGGYGYRQVLELVQNGADAILEESQVQAELQQPARIHVVLRDRYLYVANTGAPLSQDGVDALLQSHSSPKRGNQIGRFGLGFKSLLRLAGCVDIFSAEGSLRFDPERCRDEIRKEFQLEQDVAVPSLRFAWAIDREVEEAIDTQLSAFSWATTIVRAEIRDLEIRPHLQAEIQRFPQEFLLFLPVAVSLTLDANAGTERQLWRKPDGLDMILHDGEGESRWRVFEKSEVHIADVAARSDATHIHRRDSVPIAWAMPLDTKREQAGRFWAFFPTETPTRLPGILNAPWKLNSDRNSLIPGDWNKALMREAAKLVAENLPTFATTADPGRPLDAFPRKLDLQTELAAPLVEALWDHIKSAPVVADAAGTMRTASGLKRPPRDDQDLHEEWCVAATPLTRTGWIHPTCLSGDRPARLSVLADRLRTANAQPLTQTKATDWFREVASTDIELTKRVLELAKHYADRQQLGQWQQDLKLLAIIPSSNGHLCTPDKLVIAPDGIAIPGLESVASALVDDAESERILIAVLQVKSLDENGWKDILKRALPKDKSELRWQQFWVTLRQAPEFVRNGFIDLQRRVVRVRRRDGAWTLYDQVLAPGHIVHIDDPEKSNDGLLVDSATHVGDHEFLQRIGVSDCPSGTCGPDRYDLVVGDSGDKLRTWLDFVETDYRAQLDTSRKPQSGYLRPLSLSLPIGWMMLSEVKGLANARLTKKFLETLVDHGETIDFGHTTQGNVYTPTEVAHPMRWFVRQYGTIALGGNAIPISTVVARRDRTVLAKIDGWNGIAPKLDLLVNLVGGPPPTNPSAAQLKKFWQAIFQLFATSERLAKDNLQDLWSEAASDGQTPDVLQSGSGDLPLTDVYVTSSANLARRAREQGKTAVTLDTDTLKLWLEKGAMDLKKLFRPDWDESLTEPVRIETAVPELVSVLRDESKQSSMSRSVRGLRLVIEAQALPIPCLHLPGVLILDSEQLDRLPRTQRLTTIINEAAAAGWLNCSVDEAKRLIADAQVEANRARVATGSTLEERLLLAVGNRTEPMTESLGDAPSKVIPKECEPLKIARLTLAMLGPTILQRLAPTLDTEGLQPPKRWGTDEARAFVNALGFPEAFAVASESKREAEVSISGPIELPSLHDYQVEVVNGLQQLFQSGTGRRRAVVSLPTGGGKTRVTVQAAVDLVLKPEDGNRTVLWVAQTDELCEQAVQSFRQVWLNRGAPRTDLRIVRLWGGNGTPAADTQGKPVVVIATIQTLNSRIGKDDLKWLATPGLVVIDECHHAIAPSYTGLLKFLDAEAPRLGSQPRDEPPVIGLSATPFRSATDDDESLRLAKRFDQMWLPAGQRELHDQLTKRGILAVANHEKLKSPSLVSPELITRFEEVGELEGFQLENLLDELNRLLANDDERNQLLIETIQKSEQQSILFFANSVNHAQEIAIRLNLVGISAAAISGETASSARRYFLDEFQRGDVRVLCNHSVLTTGFDAPKTDMVLIARQVQSPVRYMQMVGRGLRGVKNGGTERCRIVTVMENLGRFAEKHPYHFCSKYFSVSP